MAQTITNNGAISCMGMARTYVAPASAMTFAAAQATWDGTNWVTVAIVDPISHTRQTTGYTARTTPFYVEHEGAINLRFNGLSANVSAEVSGIPFGLPPQPYKVAILGGLGDSQIVSGITTTPGNDIQDLSIGRLGAMTTYNCLFWASGVSGGKLAYAGMVGATGQTCQQIHDSYLAAGLAEAKASGWTFVAISVGTNDIAGGIPYTTTMVYLERIVRAFLAIKVIPVIMGVLPNRVTTGAAHDRLNLEYRWLANKYGLVFEDAWRPHVQASDGLGIAAHFRDNTHLTGAQNLVRGQRLSALILAAYPWLSASYHPASNAAGKLGLWTNPVFTANSGAVTPTGWTISGVGATTNVAAGTSPGNEWTLTRGANSVSAVTATFTKGKKYLFYCRLESVNVANSGSEFGFRDPAFNPAAHAWRFVVDVELPANFKPCVVFTIPSASPFTDNYFRIVTSGANPSNYLASEMELYELAS